MGVRLPSAYQEVEYIESTGTQIIDTDYLPVDGDEMSIEFAFTVFGNAYYCLAATNNEDPQVQFVFGQATSGSRLKVLYYKYFSTGDAARIRSNFSTGQKYIIDVDSNGDCACNGVTVSPINNLGYATGHLRFFARMAGNVNFHGRLYKFVASHGGIEKVDLVPCYRKADDEAGLYDLVSGTFFTNAGTGEFIVGPDVIDSISPWLVARRRLLMYNVSRYIYEASNLSFNGKSDCINTGVYLFTQENIDRDFEFIAEGIVGKGNIHAGDSTIICAKYDDGALGFLVRPTGSTSLDYKGTICVKRNTNSTVIVRRINGVITLSGTNITNPTIQFTNAVFNHPLVFGCALQNDGTPYRYCQGTIAHVTVRWL